MATLLNSPEYTYDELCYPLGRIKSLIGKRKFIILNKAYIDGIFVAVPIRVAIKADTDPFAAIRAIHGDVASFSGAAGAFACNGGSGLSAYI